MTRATTARPGGRAIGRRAGVPSVPVLLVAAVVLVLVTLDVLLGGPLSRLDTAISHAVSHWDLRDRTSVRLALTVLLLPGQRGVIAVVALALCGWFAWTRRRSEPLIRLVVAFLALALVVFAAKFAIDRPAPSDLRVGRRHGTSYPSGHLANAVLIWGVLDAMTTRYLGPGRVRTAVSVMRIAAPFAILIGMTLLDYHWFSDFVGGAAAGTLLLALALAPVWTTVAAAVDRHTPGLHPARATR